MTTSPSWFDQEKFSRLVKKVGPKPSPGQVAREAAGRLSQVGKAVPTEPPSPLPASKPELRPEPQIPVPSSVSSAPLPALRPIFEYDMSPVADTPPQAAEPQPVPKVSAEVRPVRAKAQPEAATRPEGDDNIPAPQLQQSNQDLAEAWERITSLNEELFRAIQERDQARSEGVDLREQLRQAGQMTDDRAAMAAQIDELSRVAQERDQAKIEIADLRDRLRVAQESAVAQQSGGASAEELSRVIQERDNARREYADLREVYETLKQYQGAPESGSDSKSTELEQEVALLRQQLAEKEQQGVKENAGGMEDVIQTLKQQLNTLQEEVAQAKDDASVAQRGLALSQKALQETRDALREASEGSSMTKGNLANLKSECSTLVQQNMLLQAQLDQVSRELSAAKSKVASRG